MLQLVEFARKNGSIIVYDAGERVVLEWCWPPPPPPPPRVEHNTLSSSRTCKLVD